MSEGIKEKKQAILASILNWDLDSASKQLEEAANTITPADRAEIATLLNRYRGYERILAAVQKLYKTNPLAAEIRLNQIPKIIRITSPKYREIQMDLEEKKEKSQNDSVWNKCLEAESLIKNELDGEKAAASIEAIKDYYPRWSQDKKVRVKIEEISELTSRLSEGLKIQREISALREKGGMSSYQKGLEYLNTYESLGLENQGIRLFDVESERESLLQMMVRAEGESWTYRLSPTTSEEIIRLEQSIRSLEDAEKKNLRVLLNNNARLLAILIKEKENMPADSDQSIQTTVRIDEIRASSQKLETDIREEVAQRAEEYCGLALQALEAGELSIAESHLRLAKDAGKPSSENDKEDYLGEISLPTDVQDQIERLEERYRIAAVKRTETHEKVEEIRKQYYQAHDDVTLKELFSWIVQLNTCAEADPNTPGLSLLHTEISNRYEAVCDFMLEKLSNEIDSALKDGDIASAREKLDSLGILFNSDAEKERLHIEMEKIAEVEKLFRDAEGIETEFKQFCGERFSSLRCDDVDYDHACELNEQINHIFEAHSRAEAKEKKTAREQQLRTLSRIKEVSGQIQAVKSAAVSGQFSDEVLTIAEMLASTDLYTLSSVKTLLTRFWANYADVSKDPIEIQRGYAHAETIALDIDDGELHSRIAASRSQFNEKNDEGKQINQAIETMNGFLSDKNYAAGIDYVTNRLKPSIREVPQVTDLAGRIEQAFRLDQSNSDLAQAKEALENGELNRAEELVTASLDFFYSVEGAQLQKEILSRQETEERALVELQTILDSNAFDLALTDENALEQLRYFRDKTEVIDSENPKDLLIHAKAETIRERIRKNILRETEKFTNLKSDFERSLLSGEDGLTNAAGTLREIEDHSWLSDFSDDIARMRILLNRTENIHGSLKTVISQAEKYARMGDFRSAKRMLDSYNADNLRGSPGWLLIQRDNALSGVEEMRVFYLRISEQFDRSNEKAGSILSEIQLVFESCIPDEAGSIALNERLIKERSILQNDIGVTDPDNPYLRSIAFLIEILQWGELIAEFSFGVDIPQTAISVDPLYQMRRTGKKLFENIPPLIIDVQAIISRENKWLEDRIRVRQSFQIINDCFSEKGRIKRGRQNDVEMELKHLTAGSLLAEETETVENVDRMINIIHRNKGCLWSSIAALIALLAGLYYFLPWIVQYFGR